MLRIFQYFIRIFLLFFVLTFAVSPASAQSQPRYSQYLLNPFLYNPAFAGQSGRHEIHLNHRRQWVGISQAPVVSTLSYHTGMSSGLSLGLNVYNFTRGLLTTNSGQVALGYQALLGQHHRLQFGLSGGASATHLDYARIDNPNDPAVLSAFDKKMAYDGKFGINYQVMGLNIGFTLPSLLNNQTFAASGEGDESLQLDPFSQYIVHADYKIKLHTSPLLFQPYVLYHVNPALPAQWEGGGLVYFDDKVHAGGSYRQHEGLTAMMGFSLTKDMRLGYAYDFAPRVVNTIGQGSHELQLSFRFGSKKTKKPVAANPSEEPTQPEKSLQEVEQVVTAPAEKDVVPPVVAKEDQPEPAMSTLRRGNHSEELPAGYFVVVGVYSNQKNTARAMRTLAQKGYKTSFGYNSQTNRYYVYVSQSSNINQCRKVRDQYRKQKLFADAWMLEITE